MGKKKETISDILDRIQEDIDSIREKYEELENEIEDDDLDSDEE